MKQKIIIEVEGGKKTTGNKFGLTRLEKFCWENGGRASKTLATELNRTEQVICAAYTRAHNKITQSQNGGTSGCKWVEENAANAKLIAAAPELLEALKAIERGLTNGQKERGETVQSIARAAITKATNQD